MRDLLSLLHIAPATATATRTATLHKSSSVAALALERGRPQSSENAAGAAESWLHSDFVVQCRLRLVQSSCPYESRNVELERLPDIENRNVAGGPGVGSYLNLKITFNIIMTRDLPVTGTVHNLGPGPTDSRAAAAP